MPEPIERPSPLLERIIPTGPDIGSDGGAMTESMKPTIRIDPARYVVGKQYGKR